MSVWYLIVFFIWYYIHCYCLAIIVIIMSNLQQRQEKIQIKRKQTSFRDFVRECASRQQFNFYKIDWRVSRYPDTNRISKLVDADSFYEINQNTYIDYNNSISFFENFRELWNAIHLPYLRQFWPWIENSKFADTLYNSKNCYLSVSTGFNTENMLYSLECHGNLNTVISSVWVHSNCTNIFQCAGVADSFNIFYCYNIQNSSDIWFSSNLIWCSFCILCDGLENCSYYINNISYTKDEYLIESAKILADKKLFDNYKIMRHIPANLWCHNINNAQFASYVNNANNICLVGWDKEAKRSDLYDVWSSWWNINDAYGCMWVSPGDNFYCVINSWFVHSIYYSYFLTSCSFCLWCIWLKNKSYCILNKQYTKEERYEKVDEIFTQMERDWQLWEFFPATMNPFYFNDTAAYLIDPSFTKEEVTKLWYLRRDEPIKVDIPEWAITVKSSELAQFESIDEQWNWKLDETVCKRVILDENGDAYRIIPMELEFLQKHGLPLPRKHWLTRMKENFRIS